MDTHVSVDRGAVETYKHTKSCRGPGGVFGVTVETCTICSLSTVFCEKRSAVFFRQHGFFVGHDCWSRSQVNTINLVAATSILIDMSIFDYMHLAQFINLLLYIFLFIFFTLYFFIHFHVVVISRADFRRQEIL